MNKISSNNTVLLWITKFEYYMNLVKEFNHKDGDYRENVYNSNMIFKSRLYKKIDPLYRAKSDDFNILKPGTFFARFGIKLVLVFVSSLLVAVYLGAKGFFKPQDPPQEIPFHPAIVAVVVIIIAVILLAIGIMVYFNLPIHIYLVIRGHIEQGRYLVEHKDSYTDYVSNVKLTRISYYYKRITAPIRFGFMFLFGEIFERAFKSFLAAFIKALLAVITLFIQFVIIAIGLAALVLALVFYILKFIVWLISQGLKLFAPLFKPVEIERT
ncbi:MAG: hypothetical protein GY754_17020 [bacterium]|nr:hypothetical protein [bacterium]